MWHRNEAQPTTYRGVLFRSALEAKVAKELDDLTVQWEYETPAPGVTWYLPDFTITGAPADLQLPQWVEVKPAELLYAVRDHVGCAELFTGTHVARVDALALRDAQLTELCKPKRLAELTGSNVLVVSAINRTRTLSVLMTPTHLELSRAHAAVNYREVLRKREQARKEAEWQAEYEQRQAEREAEQQRWREHVIEHARAAGRAARYGGVCQLCRQEQPADLLRIYRDSNGWWRSICQTHLAPAPT